MLLHIKRGDESLFLLEAAAGTSVEELLHTVVQLHNARLKILRVCAGVELLAQYGPSLPPEMQGLTEEQIEELKLRDDWAEKSVASGGEEDNRDLTGKRRGKQPIEKMRKILQDTVREAKGLVSKELVKSGSTFTSQHTNDALSMLSGAIKIVYPASLPPYDPIREELENRESLEGTQEGKMVLEPALSQLWFAGKELQCDRQLKHYVGTNEKTKVIVKVQKRGLGAPSREPKLSAEQQKELMAREFKRREDLKKLDADDDDDYLNSSWSDSKQLHRSFQGLCNISWKPH